MTSGFAEAHRRWVLDLAKLLDRWLKGTVSDDAASYESRAAVISFESVGQNIRVTIRDLADPSADAKVVDINPWRSSAAESLSRVLVWISSLKRDPPNLGGSSNPPT